MSAHFDLHLTPNRSLGRDQARWIVAGVGIVFLLGGVRLLVLGAWPVLPFMAVDLALLAWAFRASFHSGRAYETLRLDDAALTIRQVTHQGVERRVDLPAAWTRVRLDRISDLENRLSVASGGREVVVGRCLSPREREEVHQVIAAGLARCRGGYSRTSFIE